MKKKSTSHWRYFFSRPAFLHNIIVKEHGGHINVDGKEGEGAEFTILLPVL